jgi:4-amino-4-deoxy-L-arabinose transferase-like glycosyltransferase
MVGAVLVASENRAQAEGSAGRDPGEVDGAHTAPRSAPLAPKSGAGSVAQPEPTFGTKRQPVPDLAAASLGGLPLGEARSGGHDDVRVLSLARSARVGVAAATILGAYLATRLWFAGHFPYFVDEGLYANFTAQGARSVKQLFVALVIGQGPLQPWLAIIWVKLGFGPLTAVRLVSVTSGLLTVGIVGLLGRRLGGAAVGWAAAALCLVLPFFVVHDGIGIYEPLVTLIMVGALYLQLALVRRPGLALGVLLGLVLGAGILTKENTLPALVLLPVSLLCFDWSPAGRRRRLSRWLAGAAIAIAMVIAAELVLRSSAYYKQLQEVRATADWPARSLTGVLDDPFLATREAWSAYWPALIGYVTIPLIAASILGAVMVWRARARLAAVLLAWIFVPAMIALLFELRPYPRHVMYLMGPAIVLMAYALVQVARWALRELGAPAAAIGCSAASALLLAPALVLDSRVLAHPATAAYPGLDYWQYVAGPGSGSPWPAVVHTLRQRGIGRKIVVLTPGFYPILTFLLAHDHRYVVVDATTSSAPASRAQFLVNDAIPDLSGATNDQLPPQLAKQHFVAIGRYPRRAGPCAGPREPACGRAVTVFER